MFLKRLWKWSPGYIADRIVMIDELMEKWKGPVILI